MRYQGTFFFDIPKEYIEVQDASGSYTAKPAWQDRHVTFITKSAEHIPIQTNILARTVAASIPPMHTANEYIYYMCILESHISFAFYKTLRDTMIRERILSSEHDLRLFFVTDCKGTLVSAYIMHYHDDSSISNMIDQPDSKIAVHDVMFEVADLQVTCSDALFCEERHREMTELCRSNYSLLRRGMHAKDEYFNFLVERNGSLPIRILVFPSENEYSRSQYCNCTIKDEQGELIIFQKVIEARVVVRSRSFGIKSLAKACFEVPRGRYRAHVCFAGQNTIDMDRRETGDDFYCVFLINEQPIDNDNVFNAAADGADTTTDVTDTADNADIAD